MCECWRIWDCWSDVCTYCSVLVAVIVEECVLSFFFEQKTADEVRISDGSSDVCSSDLAVEHVDVQPALRADQGGEQADRPRAGHQEGDRKSVVSGKSVSVRVDLGGRRIITKKNILALAICIRQLKSKRMTIGTNIDLRYTHMRHRHLTTKNHKQY